MKHQRRFSLIMAVFIGLILTGLSPRMAAAQVSDQPDTPFKLATFEASGMIRIGMEVQNKLMDLNGANAYVTKQLGLHVVSIPDEMRTLIERYGAISNRMYQIANYMAADNRLKNKDLGFVFDPERVSFKAPIKYPYNLLAAAANYKSHAQEMSGPPSGGGAQAGQGADNDPTDGGDEDQRHQIRVTHDGDHGGKCFKEHCRILALAVIPVGEEAARKAHLQDQIETEEDRAGGDQRGQGRHPPAPFAPDHAHGEHHGGQGQHDVDEFGQKIEHPHQDHGDPGGGRLPIDAPRRVADQLQDDAEIEDGDDYHQKNWEDPRLHRVADDDRQGLVQGQADIDDHTAEREDERRDQEIGPDSAAGRRVCRPAGFVMCAHAGILWIKSG